ncbi:MAG: hypothetical protein OHK0045_03820 [Raineya sp.]
MKNTLIILLLAFSIQTALAQEVRYDFKFDWIAVYKDNPSFNPLNGLDIYGIGWCRLFVKNKVTGNEDQIMPTGFKYIGNYGRVLEIPRNEAIRFDKNMINNTGPKTLSNTKIRFQFDPTKYGYKNAQEVLDNAFFKIVFEIKERGLVGKTDDNMGKKEAIVMLRDANVAARSMVQVKNGADSQTQVGLMRWNKNKLNIGVFYSIVPIQ